MKNSPLSERYDELRTEVRADLTTPETALLELAAMLSLQTDAQRDAILAGFDVDADRVADVADAFCAAVETLGLT
jgi:hypothetical protein